MIGRIAKLDVHRLSLAILGLCVGAYVVGVMWVAIWSPDIGIHCAFRPVITDPVITEETQVGSEKRPAEGDTLLRVAGAPIETTPQLWSQVLVIRALNREADQDSVRLTPEGKQVLVDFRAASDGKVHSTWCMVGTLPLREMVPSFLWLLLKFILVSIGVLLFWKRPGDRSAAQFFLLCIVTLGAYIGGYHWARISVHPVLLTGFMICGVVLPAVTLHFYLLFPRPKETLEHRPGWCLLAIYGPAAGFFVALFIAYWRVRRLFPNDPVSGAQVGAALGDAWETLRVCVLVYLVVAACWYLASVVCLVHSYWTARIANRVTERNQVKWILIGSVAAACFIAYSLYLVLWQHDFFGSGAATWPMFAASACFTAAFGVSITRYRLMQLDQLLSSGMVYFLISFAAGVFYYVVFAGMLLSGVIAGRPSLSQAVVMSTMALFLMVVLDLARSRLKKVLDRRFAREKHQLDHTLMRMGQAIEQLVDPPTLARRLLQTSAELLNVPRGAIYLREGEPPLYRLAGCLGERPPVAELPSNCPLVEALQRGGALVAPRSTPVLDPARRQLLQLGGEVAHALAHEGQLLALLVLGPKDLGFYGGDDLNLLAAFAQVTALALESAERHRTIEGLNGELRSKVEKISEQQRRILALQSQLLRQRPVPEEPSTAVIPAGTTATILGSSPAAQQLLEMVRKVTGASTQSAVLIRGESGSGKGLLARVLHDNGPRSAKPFVKVHCAALSPGLLESELFGHVKGAFTSAHRERVGRFELADGGTLFLDEIGDIGLEVQTKLLRVLEEKTFERVGSSEPVHVDVHVIAATHQNLEELIRQQRFRSDLYYRLKVIDIMVPPLRQRPEDIPELAQHFLKVYAGRCGRGDMQIDDDAMIALRSHAWRGNVRELENVLERAVVVSEGSLITIDDLPAELTLMVDEPVLKAQRAVPIGVGNGKNGIRVERAERASAERERLVRALSVSNGNKAEAARLLGLARSTFLSRLKRHGLS
jgi:transcriptional regulator with GAF, ATPase, and Fis domain